MKTEIKQVFFDLKQLIVPPGNTVQMENVSWEMFENILQSMGEGSAVRLAYYNETVEIKMPLLGHEDDKEIISDLVKALLEELNIDFRSVGSTTFKRENMQSGVEPDQCFYIQNEAAIRGKREIDLTVDPPPDLALEIDNTSDSRVPFNSYQALGVTELWRYDGRELKINLLQDKKYVESNTSPNFPELPITEIITQYVKQSQTAGRSPTMKAFRAWVREQLQ
ncbi:Uma2 family endonuclease [Argonema antarcticum]|uniref:Uma2 family endonuclease n=1 Tax=Argonema antarcticum TaxID=2942763 RepID=UPI002012854C|nr:Uma2 family endonuclease [Argonema antarcticum]MCL1474750.1 Uma2 family endonuclease [Argonema antarcticum A004/B2]